MARPRGGDWAGLTCRYQYDDAGRQTAVIDPLGSRTTFTYDGVGRMLTTTQWLDELAGYTTRTAYNEAGQVETTTDANERVTTYHYDPLGRLLSTDYPGGVSTSQTYDEAGGVKHRPTRTAQSPATPTIRPGGWPASRWPMAPMTHRSQPTNTTRPDK